MPKIDIDAIPASDRTYYPEAFRYAETGRSRKRLGTAVGLTQFGVNLTRLAPGGTTGLRHWHEQEDEFVFILEGEATLIEDDGEHVLRAGEAAGYKAGVANGHQIVNKSDSEVVLLEIGSRAARERSHYTDVDMTFERDETGYRFLHKSGEPYA